MGTEANSYAPCQALLLAVGLGRRGIFFSCEHGSRMLVKPVLEASSIHLGWLGGMGPEYKGVVWASGSLEFRIAGDANMNKTPSLKSSR